MPTTVFACCKQMFGASFGNKKQIFSLHKFLTANDLREKFKAIGGSQVFLKYYPAVKNLWWHSAKKFEKIIWPVKLKFKTSVSGMYHCALCCIFNQTGQCALRAWLKKMLLAFQPCFEWNVLLSGKAFANFQNTTRKELLKINFFYSAAEKNTVQLVPVVLS